MNCTRISYVHNNRSFLFYSLYFHYVLRGLSFSHNRFSLHLYLNVTLGHLFHFYAFNADFVVLCFNFGSEWYGDTGSRAIRPGWLILGRYFNFFLSLLLLFIMEKFLLFRYTKSTVPILVVSWWNLHANAHPMIPRVAIVAADHWRAIILVAACGTYPYLTTSSIL